MSNPTLPTLLQSLQSALQTLSLTADPTEEPTASPSASLLLRRDPQVLSTLDACLSPTQTDIREAFLGTLLQTTAQRLTLLNQYAQLDAPTARSVARIGLSGVRSLRDVLRGGDDEEVLELAIQEIAVRHRDRLVTLLRDQLDPALQVNWADHAPVCAQYSPETQMSVLGLDLDHIVGPVLDLGCGADAHLVTWLRQNGIEAHGIDRNVQPQPWTERADWLTHPLEVGAWGTILSHMAFSNHFIHHHLHPRGQAEACARRYMQVLAGLVPGGVFVYAPGLPFIEALLDPEEFRVARRPVAAIADHEAIVALAGRIGQDVAFATHVTLV